MRMTATIKFCGRVLGATAAVISSVAIAQSFPSKPIRWIVPFAPGGPADALARVIQPKAQERFGQPFIIESRPGASGNLGAEQVLKSSPDGYTLLYAVPGLTTNPFFVKGSPDPRDFTPIARFSVSATVLIATPNFAPNSVQEVIAAIRAKPGAVTCASSGALPTVGCELLRSYAKADILNVNYKGNAPAMLAVQSGEVNMLFDPLSSSIAPIRAGKVKVIATLDKKRGGTLLPDLPAAAEVYPDFWFDGWTGTFGPGGMPRELVMRLNRDFNAATASPEVTKIFTQLGLTVVNELPEHLGETVRLDLAKFGKVTADAGIKPE
ncbi:MAG: Bug family tripartite tricarboxylate transporter substrate binding protein [Burkholderiales bacterium]